MSQYVAAIEATGGPLYHSVQERPFGGPPPVLAQTLAEQAPAPRTQPYPQGNSAGGSIGNGQALAVAREDAAATRHKPRPIGRRPFAAGVVAPLEAMLGT